MTMFQHEPDCDRAHTMRQRCNARGLRGGPFDDVALTIPYDTSEATPATALEPTAHAGLTLRDEPSTKTHAPTVTPAVQTVDASADDVAAPAASRAIADGPLQPTDTAGFSVRPLIAVLVVSIGVLAGGWRVVRRHRLRATNRRTPVRAPERVATPPDPPPR